MTTQQNLKISLFPQKTFAKHHESIIQQIESIERKTFPKHEVIEVEKNAQKNQEIKIKIYGYIIYSYLASNNSLLPLTRILKICIHQDYRGQGLGTMILKHAIDTNKVPEKSKAELYVDVKRQVAIKLYEKFGFKIKELVKDYYQPERDAYLMVLE
ncbi:9310_t:CDS:2 [Entrophospora sp. SA101]|nr:9310_t:CDS:2 [Entrophospora sp. SA101]CAJ0840477.1 4271_t:CDS:2 [Entrophospora sp. SA101]CAJ0849027.1 21819_t:CDS:2 [Entrophospora sp. SA101]CAJ0925106.1 3405_t:CDS:2 [Entrophospora sp. SA101]